MADKAALVSTIKEMQRSDSNAREAWWEYCDTQLAGVRDPNRHDSHVLQEFLARQGNPDYQPRSAQVRVYGSTRPCVPQPHPTVQCQNAPWAQPHGVWGAPTRGLWAPPQPMPSSMCAAIPTPSYGYPQQHPQVSHPGIQTGFSHQAPHPTSSAASGNMLADFVKTGQRQSPNWKAAWQAYCSTHGVNKFDPGLCESSFITAFIDCVGSMALMGISGGASHKRPLDSNCMPATKRQATGPVDPDKAEFVDRIKALQRSSPDAKQAWWDYCDQKLSGIRDPNRHDAETLRAYLENFGDT